MKKTLLLALALIASAFSYATAQENDVTTVVEGDFSVVTAGSPEAPVAFPSYGEGAFTTLFPSWYQSNVKQAGGQILVLDGGYFRIPNSDLSAYSGTVKVNARIKMMDVSGGCFKLSIGYSITRTLIIPDNDWHDISVIMSGATSYSYVRFEPFLAASGVLVKSVSVQQSPLFVAAPVALQPNQADGTSFTARWNSVKGATGYFLDVYSYAADGAKDYVVNNEELASNATTRKVEGLDPSKQYYFVVRATNGTGLSEDSNEIKVVKVLYYLTAPANVNVTASENGFSASWDVVEDAQWYTVNVTATRTLAQEENVDLINEDFSKITSGTLDKIDFINFNVDPYTQTPGWEGTELGKAEGNIVLTPYSGYTGYLLTPAIDLSSSGGNFTVDLDMALAAFGTFYSGETAKVYALDEEGNTLSSSEITFSKGYASYSVELTGGLSSCRVGISYSGNYKVFIDNMKVSQVKEAGAKISTLFCEEETETTSFSAEVENPSSDTSYTITVWAGAETVRGSSVEPIYSEASEPVEFTVGISVGINETASGNDTVRVFTLDGRDVTGKDLAKGIYLLVGPSGTKKVLVK